MAGRRPGAFSSTPRVKVVMEDVPDLPNFSKFTDAFRDRGEERHARGHIRGCYYLAYGRGQLRARRLAARRIEQRLARGPELVSANFVIPYPPGFPIMVPGQVITGIITFMRKLDVKEIHGYDSSCGLKLLKPSALKRRARVEVPTAPDANAAVEREAAEASVGSAY
jgi:arginine decarboxylase